MLHKVSTTPILMYATKTWILVKSDERLLVYLKQSQEENTGTDKYGKTNIVMNFNLPDETPGSSVKSKWAGDVMRIEGN
jgi:hypothetical protein